MLFGCGPREWLNNMAELIHVNFDDAVVSGVDVLDFAPGSEEEPTLQCGRHSASGLADDSVTVACMFNSLFDYSDSPGLSAELTHVVWNGGFAVIAQPWAPALLTQLAQQLVQRGWTVIWQQKAVANLCDAKKPYRCLILHHAEGDPSDPSCSLDRVSSACSATICRNVATQPLELPSEAATAENPPVLTSPAHGSVVQEVVEAARHLLTLLIAAPLSPSMPPAAPRTGPTVSTAQGYSPARIAVDHGRGTPGG